MAVHAAARRAVLYFDLVAACTAGDAAALAAALRRNEAEFGTRLPLGPTRRPAVFAQCKGRAPRDALNPSWEDEVLLDRAARGGHVRILAALRDAGVRVEDSPQPAKAAALEGHAAVLAWPHTARDGEAYVYAAASGRVATLDALQVLGYPLAEAWRAEALRTAMSRGHLRAYDWLAARAP